MRSTHSQGDSWGTATLPAVPLNCFSGATMGNLTRYLVVLDEIKKNRGAVCECCSTSANHGHHIIPVSETSIASELVFEPANIMLLCDDCHALMHPCLRNVSDWQGARERRGHALAG